MEVIAGLWLLFAAVPAILASQKGRSAVGWFVLALVISPLLAARRGAVPPVPQRPGRRSPARTPPTDPHHAHAGFHTGQLRYGEHREQPCMRGDGRWGGLLLGQQRLRSAW